MKKLLFLMILLWGGAGLGLWLWNDAEGQAVSFRTVPARRGDLLATINATGTIEPEEVVDVGAQVAGELKSFGKDPGDEGRPIGYGSQVEVGTVLARLDDAIPKARVTQAEASVARAEAEVEQADAKFRQADREWKRSQKLAASDARVVSRQERENSLANFEAAQAALDVAKGAAAVARANLEEARVNLRYTTITSPVRGVILDRRVNLGQMVGAGPGGPSLFLIARDLSRMEIWASVNETDVGAIRLGQEVRFTVPTYPNETFRGKVTQVRLNASMIQSVVSYTVVVGLDNPGGKLLPYLTARLQFEVAERKGALLVPGAALRWRPKPAHVLPSARAAFEDAQRERPGSRGGSGARERGILWVRQGEYVRPVLAKVGLSDGLLVEVDAGDELKDGSEVVVGVARREEGDDGATPFLPQIKNDKAAKPKK